ncbi:MAG: hypothetical protein ACI4WS_05475 [Oscillospiraceae bacterium]
MEILLGAVMIIILLALVGVDIWYILLGVIALIALAALFTAVLFAVGAVMLLRGRRCSGMFLRFDEGKRFEYAVYSIDGGEYGNIFPAEMVMRERLYKPDVPVKLHLTKKGHVFDRNAFLTTVIGLPVSMLITAVFAGGFAMLLGLM